MRQVSFILFLQVILFTLQANAQQKDSTQAKTASPIQYWKKKTQIYGGPTTTQAQTRFPRQEKKTKLPSARTIYSAILPGAGQVYNKKYWKVPIVYAAIGIPAYFYFYNKNYYNNAQYALVVTINGSYRATVLSNVNSRFSSPWSKSGNTNGHHKRPGSGPEISGLFCFVFPDFLCTEYC